VAPGVFDTFEVFIKKISGESCMRNLLKVDVFQAVTTNMDKSLDLSVISIRYLYISRILCYLNGLIKYVVGAKPKFLESY
jgi:hypothetical protein